MNESYPERLQREIDEARIQYPGIETAVSEAKKAFNMSNSDCDYHEEKESAIYDAFIKFAKSLK